MGKFMYGMLVGLVIGAAVSYFYHQGRVKVPEVHTKDVQEEVSRYGDVIKDKAKGAGAAIADVTADARATAAIKSKLASELGAGSLTSISVNTSDGLTTLSGTVASQEDLDKAVGLAYSVEGVKKVYSTLQVKGGN
jgi:hyperosmotically inducible protein